jgi:hypothetical protein
MRSRHKTSVSLKSSSPSHTYASVRPRGRSARCRTRAPALALEPASRVGRRAQREAPDGLARRHRLGGVDADQADGQGSVPEPDLHRVAVDRASNERVPILQNCSVRIRYRLASIWRVPGHPPRLSGLANRWQRLARLPLARLGGCSGRVQRSRRGGTAVRSRWTCRSHTTTFEQTTLRS